MLRVILWSSIVWVSACVGPGQARGEGGRAPGSDQEKTLYAIGISLGRSLEVFHLTPQELEVVRQGMNDTVLARPLAVSFDDHQEAINRLAALRGSEKAARERGRAKEYLEKAAQQPGTEKLPSGVLYREQKAGEGPQPRPSDIVKVHYRGVLFSTGREFDSSYKRGEPTEFPLDGVIQCWTEGVQRMKVGGKATLICPPEVAYGERGAPPNVPGGATLIFEVELLEARAPPEDDGQLE